MEAGNEKEYFNWSCGCWFSNYINWSSENVECFVNECVNDSRVKLCVVRGMGHTYPGGMQYLPESKIGPVSDDMTFGDIWNFLVEN